MRLQCTESKHRMGSAPPSGVSGRHEFLVSQLRHGTLTVCVACCPAIPPGMSAGLLTLWITGTTLDVMSLMGMVMPAGVAASNSTLIVEFAHHLLLRSTLAAIIGLLLRR